MDPRSIKAVRLKEERRADMVNDFWSARGVKANARAVPAVAMDGTLLSGVYAIESDTLNGRPRVHQGANNEHTIPRT